MSAGPPEIGNSNIDTNLPPAGWQVKLGTQIQTISIPDRKLGGEHSSVFQIFHPVYEIQVLNLPPGREFCIDVEGFGRSQLSVGGVMRFNQIKFSSFSDVLLPEDVRNLCAGKMEFDLKRLPSEISAGMEPSLNFAVLRTRRVCLVVPGDEFITHGLELMAKNYNLLIYREEPEISSFWRYTA
jgi:hypothetical protein